MRKLLIVATMWMMLVGVGCQSGKNPSAAEKDACPMCEGFQAVNKDGTCPKCGMKVQG